MRLLYFAWLRARIGQAEEDLPLPAGVRDVAGLLDWLRARGGVYAELYQQQRLSEELEQI